MQNVITRIVLLRSYPSPPEGPGRATFAIGRSIGIVGRTVVAGFLLVAAIAAAIDQRTLLLSFLGSYAAIAFVVLTEVLSSVLMFLGNWAAAKAARLHGREA